MLRSFNVESAKVDQLKAIDIFKKFVEDIRKWPKTMMKYSQKKNTKEYLFYYQLEGSYCMYVFLAIVFVDKLNNLCDSSN